jgi:type I restriction enzyme S subunit
MIIDMKKGDALSLPKGWEIKMLGKVCDFQNGFAFQSKTYKEDGIPVVRITNIQDEKLDLTKIVYIDPKDYNKDLSKYKIVNGDLLIAMSGATTGKIGIHKTNEELLLNQRVGKFEPKQTLDKTYLLNFLKTKIEESLAISAGAAQPNLSTEQIKAFEIPLPPLPEQQRIVAILDKTFAAIATAKANAQQNLLNAKELFESAKKNIFDNLELICNKIELPNTCDKMFAGGDVPKDNYSKTKTDEYQIPIIANAVKDNGLYGFTNKARVSKPSITIAARGSGTGHTEIRYESFFPIVRLIVLIPKTELITLEFLKYSIQNLDILSSGSAIPQLTIPMIKEYLIPLPKIEKQKQIVKKLNSLSTETKKLEGIYQQKINDLEELKKSVLSKAFKGELT